MLQLKQYYCACSTGRVSILCSHFIKFIHAYIKLRCIYFVTICDFISCYTQLGDSA